LIKDYTYTDEKGKLHTLFRDRVYSRIGERNTGADESCPSIVLEKLFARKHGEHLPVIDRFSLYLDDVANWKKVTIKNETTYYYKKHHTFKIVKLELEDDTSHKYGRRVKTEMEDYSYALDYGICEDYWRYHQQTGATYDDYCYWLNVELWADNTPIDSFTLSAYYIKYYHIDKYGLNNKYSQYFYLPVTNDLYNIAHNSIGIEEIKTQIAQTIQFKICRMLQCCDRDIPSSNYEKYLDFFNYEYLRNQLNYLKNNKDFIYKKFDNNKKAPPPIKY